MKKVLLSLMAVAVCGTMMAKEYHFGVEAGYDYMHGVHMTNVDGLDAFHNYDGMNGFHVGGTFQCDFLDGNNIPSVTLGLNYQFLGEQLLTKKEIKNGKKAWTDFGYKNPQVTDFSSIHSLQVPLRARYTHVFGDWQVFAFTGPQLGFMLGSCETEKDYATKSGKKDGAYGYMNAVTGYTHTITWVNGDKTEDRDRMDKDMRYDEWFELSWGFGVGAAWKNISLNISYDLGLVNHASETEKNFKQVDDKYYYNLNRNCLEVSVGYRFK